jgi:hypothetical protein
VRILCGEEGAGGEGCEQRCPGRSGEEMGRGIGTKGASSYHTVYLVFGVMIVGEGVL